MTFYNLIHFILTLVALSISSYLLFKLRLKSVNERAGATKTEKGLESSNLDWKIAAALIAALAFISFALIAPFLFTRNYVNRNFDFTGTGMIGDTIGGTMSPFIAIGGVIVTGLAFYIQYKANQQQRELFQVQINNQNRQVQIQQFESKFYEMLKLHRENVTEMKINGYDFTETGTKLQRFEKVTEGRKVFVTMKTELECILGIYVAHNNKLDHPGFSRCYNLFFSGIDAFKIAYRGETELIDKYQRARENHRSPADSIETNYVRKRTEESIELKFNYKPFSGHSQRLGHYFRHLYLTVRSIVDSTVINRHEDKMKYLKLLRAQLSNHEQILLFYNWLSGYGENWENNENSFFTNYEMIHNLWHDTLFSDEFIENQVDFLRTKPAKLRKGPMFEID